MSRPRHFEPAVYHLTRDGRWIRTVGGRVEDGRVRPEDGPFVTVKCDYAALELAIARAIWERSG